MKLKRPHLTWRSRKRLKALGITLGVLTAAGLLLWLCWVLWLGRFVVYTRDSVRLDFGWQTPGAFVTAEPPEKTPVEILYDDGVDAPVNRNQPLARLSGCTISAELLTGDLTELNRIIREQPKGSAILLELKNGSGTFFYDTATGGKVSGKVDREAVRELIGYLSKADYYVIASVPAFRDRAFGLDNTGFGILHSSGGYLWAGSDKCYWLDPLKTGTRNHLLSIAMELRDLGFDEVLFTDFCFPPTADILYESDQLAALNETAQHLMENLATETFCVSFACNEEGFRLPQGRTRLYRTGVDASLAQNVASSVLVPDAQVNLVYLTETLDTRFDAYGVLRPLTFGVTAPTEPPAEEPAAES